MAGIIKFWRRLVGSYHWWRAYWEIPELEPLDEPADPMASTWSANSGTATVYEIRMTSGTGR